MNIVLIGLRGSGKTMLGKILAEKLNMPLIDLDQKIEAAAHLKITEIVKQLGWDHFRQLEKEAVKNIAQTDKSIIATGGGTILDQDNVKNLKKNGFLIYLNRSPKECAQYLAEKKDRPRLTDETDLQSEMEKIYLERDPKYRKSTDFIIERQDDLEKDAEIILEKVRTLF